MYLQNSTGMDSETGTADWAAFALSGSSIRVATITLDDVCDRIDDVLHILICHFATLCEGLDR